MQQEPLQLNLTVASHLGAPLFLVMGVEFMQQVNGAPYHMNNSAFNTAAIVHLDRVANETRA